MVVEKGHKPHLRVGVVVGGDVVVVIFNLFRAAAGRGEDAVDGKIKRIIHHGIQQERPAVLRAGKGTAECFVAVINLAEHEKIRLAVCRRKGANRRAPRTPKAHVHMLHSINAKSVEARLLDPIFVNRRHVRADISGLGAEIVEAAQFAQLHLIRVVVILNRAVVVKQIRQRVVGGVVS